MLGVEISITQHQGLEGLEGIWRELEARLPEISFFRGWSWVGCLAEERFPDPVVLQARRDGVLVGLALFNRRGRRLYLGESGDPVLDAPFVEHNGPLTLGIPGIDAALLGAAAAMRGTRRLILSGVPANLLAEAPGIAWRVQRRLAPHVQLDEVRAAGGDPLSLLSANARHQIRRSAKHYGQPGLRRAETENQALATLREMITLHQRSWQARGKPGAFADPFQRRFHETLVRRGMARDEIDLLRVEGEQGLVGILYNFRLRGRISAYQSGFDLTAAGPHGKPGLTCHAMAIARAAAGGEAIYDFLGGDDRYKRTLARHGEALFWAEMVPCRSFAGIAAWMGNFALRHVRRPQSSRGSSSAAEGTGPD